MKIAYVSSTERNFYRVLIAFFSLMLVIAPIILMHQGQYGSAVFGFIVAMTALVATLYGTFLGDRYYWVDCDGITTHMLGRKKYHFNWEEFVSFSLYSVCNQYESPRHMMVFSIKDCELPGPHSLEYDHRYLKEYKRLVVFQFTPERYEYIRQFCDLPLTDNRRKTSRM